MSDARRFVTAFEAYWSAPSVAGLDALLCPDVVLIQPLVRRSRGLARARVEFGRIFALLPDLTATVERWSAAGDALFIELRFRATLGGRSVEWPVVDRFLLANGLVAERVSYFDPSTLVAALARRPRSWPRFLRSGIWRGWLGGRGDRERRPPGAARAGA